MDERIAEAIQAVVNEATFQPEVLTRMKAAIERVAALEATLEQREAQLSASQRTVRDLKDVRDTALREIAEVRAQEADLQLREKAVHDAEKSQAAHEAAAQTWEKACGLIFRNTSVRRTMFDSETGAAVQDQFGNWHTPNVTKNLDETVEET